MIKISAIDRLNIKGRGDVFVCELSLSERQSLYQLVVLDKQIVEFNHSGNLYYGTIRGFEGNIQSPKDEKVKVGVFISEDKTFALKIELKEKVDKLT